MSLWMLGATKEDWKARLPFIIGFVAFIYYVALSADVYTWIFAGSDSGDWLAASTIWMVPQPYGSPLYILLGHLLNLFPGDLVIKMTIILTCIPSAITVAVTYLSVLHLTHRVLHSLIASTVLMGSAVFVSQSTILEEYGLTIMFVSLAFYAYLRNWKYRTVIFLGLGSAVHVIVIALAGFWILADRRWKYWFGKPVLVYIVVGASWYALIPILMYADTPRWLIGEASLINLVAYWSGTGRTIIGMLSIFDAPARIWFVVRVVVMSFGVALIPLFTNIYKPLTRTVAILVATVLFILWYVVTCLDINAWTFLAIASPAIAIMIGLGLSKMHIDHAFIIGITACMLVIFNGVLLNANTLTKQNDFAGAYYNQLDALPSQSVVVVPAGAYSLGLFYSVANGHDLVPVIYPYMEEWELFGMQGYSEYLTNKYGVHWESTLDAVQDCIERDRPVYFIATYDSPLTRCFVFQPDPEGVWYGKPYQIFGLTGLNPATIIEAK